MTPESAQAALDFILPQLRQEFATTCKVLAAVPAEQCGYKPHERSMSALELAAHIATSEAFFASGVLKGAFEGKAPEFHTPVEVLAFYNETLPPLLNQLAALPAEKLAAPITFAIWTEPAVNFLGLNLRHSTHHRGQLSAYLRPMGARVPSIFGPSADDKMEAAAG
jgi:uncharacterized damage-inducible protein DinB